MFQPVLIGVLLSQTDELSLDTDYEKNVCLTRDFVCDVETAISEAAIWCEQQGNILAIVVVDWSGSKRWT